MGENQQKVICILGMHRSGTSLITRLLNLSGLYLGPPDRMLPPSEDNPAGYWEHRDMMAINEALFERLGISWQDVSTLSPGWHSSPDLEPLRQRVRDLIQRDFPDNQLWGWKDPRNCITLPFWQELIPQMAYVICMRNPLDVAYSLEKRDGLPLEQSLKLWTKHTALALLHTTGKPRVISFYEDYFENWESELVWLAESLGLNDPTTNDSVKAEAQSVLQQDLWHHRSTHLDAIMDATVDFPAKSLYLAIRTITLAARKPGLKRPPEANHSLWDGVLNVFGINALADAELKDQLQESFEAQDALKIRIRALEAMEEQRARIEKERAREEQRERAERQAREERQEVRLQNLQEGIRTFNRHLDRVSRVLEKTKILSLARRMGWLGPVPTSGERFPSPLLAGYRSLAQSFVADRDGLAGIHFEFATHGQQNTQDIHLLVREGDISGPIVREAVVSAWDLKEAHPHRFAFDPIADSGGRTFVMELSSLKSYRGDAVSVWCTTTDPPPGARQRYDNGRPVTGAIILALNFEHYP